MSAPTGTCPSWCSKHMPAVPDSSMYLDVPSHYDIRTGQSETPGDPWKVYLFQLDDEEEATPAGIYVGSEDWRLTAGQARAMAQALVEAADTLDAAS